MTDRLKIFKMLMPAEFVLFEGAGHSIQGDKPLELAALIERFAFA